MRPVLEYEEDRYYRHGSDSGSDSDYVEDNNKSSSRHGGDLVGNKLHAFRQCGNIGDEDEDLLQVSIGHLSLCLS